MEQPNRLRDQAEPNRLRGPVQVRPLVSTPPNAWRGERQGKAADRPRPAAKHKAGRLLAIGVTACILAFVALASLPFSRSEPSAPVAPAAPSSDPAAAALANRAANADEADLTPVGAVGVGACFIQHVDEATDRIPGVLVVPCDGPHQLEMFGHGSVPYATDAAYPGDEAVADAADSICLPLFADYVGLDYDSSVYISWYYAPDATSWTLPDRNVECAIGNETSSMMPGGSARDSRR